MRDSDWPALGISCFFDPASPVGVWGKRSLHLARKEGECGWCVGFAMVLTRTELSYEDTEQYTVLHQSRKAFVGQMETVSRSTYTCSASASSHLIDEYLPPGPRRYLLERSRWLVRHCGTGFCPLPLRHQLGLSGAQSAKCYCDRAPGSARKALGEMRWSRNAVQVSN